MKCKYTIKKRKEIYIPQRLLKHIDHSKYLKQQKEFETSPSLAMIPKDTEGNPIYEQAEFETTLNAIIEQTENDLDMAKNVIDGMIADKETALKKLQNSKSKGGSNVAEKIASEKERKKAIEKANADLGYWTEIKNKLDARLANNEQVKQPEVKIIDEETIDITNEIEENGLTDQPVELPFQIEDKPITIENNAQQLATDAVIRALTDSGIDVVNATDEMAEAVLGMADVELSAKQKRALETALPEVISSFKGTAISNADGTKIVNISGKI